MAHVQSRTANDVDTLAFNSNTVAGNALICEIGYASGGSTVASVAGDGAWSFAGTVNNTTNAQVSEVWYKLNATGGSTTGPTVTWTAATPGARRLSILESNNVAATSAHDKFTAAIGSATPASSGNVTPTTNGQYLFGGAQYFGATLTPGGAWVSRVVDSNQEAVIHDQTQATAAAIAMNPSFTGASDWAALIATFKAAAAAIPNPLTSSHFGRGKRPWSKLRTTKVFRDSAVAVTDAVLSGTTDITFSPSATLQGDSALAGATTLTFSPSGTLAGSAALSGTTALTFAPTATLLASALMSGASSLTLTPSASLVGTSALSGATSLTFTPSASLAGDAALSGSTTLTFAPSAALVGDAALSGASSLTFAPTADLTISSATTADLAGTSSITFSPSATLVGVAALSGVSSITFVPTGDLSGGAIVGGGANQNFPFIANVGTLMSR